MKTPLTDAVYAKDLGSDDANYRAMWHHAEEMELRCGELLVALEGLLNALPSATTHPAIKAARAAIAKAANSR